LKVETSGEQWAKWATKYPPEGRGIPIIYVIRADGEKLYGKSGALPGAKLPQMMLAAAQSAGRSFNDAEFALLATQVDAAKKALEANDKATVVRSLGRLKKLGRLGEISTNSYSIVAKEADELAKKVIDSGAAEIEEAKARLAEPSTAFEGLLVLLEAKRTYSQLPQLQTTVTTALRDAEKDPGLATLVSQAEGLDRARSLATQKAGSSKKRAVTAYEQLITRYPGTAAAGRALEELAELDPDSKVLAGANREHPTSQTTPDYRMWTDSSGAHRVEAKLVQIKQGWVQLEKRDGRKISLRITQLSEADQEFIRRE
jgi:hypothetical protein